MSMSLFVILGCQEDELMLRDTHNNDLTFASKNAYPEILQLPDGFQPEGIVIGPQNNFYIGSGSFGSPISGSIYKGNLQTGEGEIFITPSGPAQALGLALDIRSGYLFVAGGFTGTVSVYDYNSGVHIQTFFLNTSGFTLINDIVVTRTAAYITDSLNPILYKIPLIKNGQLPNQSEVIALPLTGDYSMDANPTNPFPLGAYANGIDATPSGKTLIIANTDRGEIYLVNPTNGEASKVDLGGAFLFNADGILLDGKTLYVVQNFMNQIAVVKLDGDLYSGSVVKYITDPVFNIPTTIDEHGSYLYAVNANFLNNPSGVFEVVKVKKK